MDSHPLEYEPLAGRPEPVSRCAPRDVCPAEVVLSVVVIVLVVVLAGPSGIASGAGTVGGGLLDAVRAIFDAGGFLRPSW